MYKHFLSELKKYSKQAIEQTKTVLDISELTFDHVCFQTTSKADHKQVIDELSSILTPIIHIPHAGRTISICRLNEPFRVNGITIDKVEISEPKPKRSVKSRSFDHFSFTSSKELDHYLHVLKSKNIKASEVKQIGEDRFFKFAIKNIEIEVRNNRIGDSVKTVDIETPPTDSMPTEISIEELKKEIEIEREKKLRALADYQNLLRRTEDEKRKKSHGATVSIISSLLTILDDFDRALSNFGENDQNATGIKMVRDKIQSLVDSHGLIGIECKEGEGFNPHIHEAVGVVAIGTDDEDNTIKQIIQKGYKLKDTDQVVRPVKVIVGRKGI